MPIKKEKIMMFNILVKTILISLFIAGASTKILAAEMDGIDVKALTTETKSLNPSQHEPEILLSRDLDTNDYGVSYNYC